MLLSNSEKTAIIINVIFTNKAGATKTIKMNLRHYLQAKKVRPEMYAPADDEAKNIVDKIPLELVPIGTTQDDVDTFERNRGTIKGRKVGKFDQLMDAIEKGLDVDELLSPQMIDSLSPAARIPKPEPERPEDILNELNKNKPAARPQTNQPVQVDSSYSKDELLLMDSEQINKVIADIPGVAKKMKEQLMKVKDKAEKVDQVYRLLATKKNK